MGENPWFMENGSKNDLQEMEGRKIERERERYEWWQARNNNGGGHNEEKHSFGSSYSSSSMAFPRNNTTTHHHPARSRFISSNCVPLLALLCLTILLLFKVTLSLSMFFFSLAFRRTCGGLIFVCWFWMLVFSF